MRAANKAAPLRGQHFGTQYASSSFSPFGPATIIRDVDEQHGGTKGTQCPRTFLQRIRETIVGPSEDFILALIVTGANGAVMERLQCRFAD
jgi:hypothetical protein